MQEDAPQIIYFFNDITLDQMNHIEDISQEHLSAIIEQSYIQISELFISNTVVNLEYNQLVQHLISSLENDISYYSHVILVGNKGADLFERIKKYIKYDKLVLININRVFLTDLSDGFECEYNYDVSSNINTTDNRILIVDDIVYTGETIKKVIDLLKLGNKNLTVASLIVFKDFVDSVSSIHSGYYIDKYSWPIDNVELWCFKDFIEKRSLNIKGKQSSSFIDDKFFCEKYVFGEHYDCAKSIVEKTRYELANHLGHDY